MSGPQTATRRDQEATRDATTALLDRVRADLAEQGLDALFVTEPANVRYLSHFSSPKDGTVLVLPDTAVLLTDGRYTAQADQESALPFEIVASADETVARMARGLRLGVESDHITVKRFRALADLLGSEPLPSTGIVSRLRAVKSQHEVEMLREAARLTDIGFKAALAFIRAGVTEVDVALELERAMRTAGADGPSFETIVASGVRGAMPHGVASQKTIETGDLVTLDFGASFRGYHADMTRTVGIGAIGAEERRMYEAVLEAQVAAVAAVRPGRTGIELDAVARDILKDHGLAERFSHSLGHGTGLAIHEDPRLSQRSPNVMEPGMIVTIEPGVYIPGFTGLRIEDLVLVTEDGHEVLSHSPKDLITL
jgi:Xaa-Pro aminopeptidase